MNTVFGQKLARIRKKRKFSQAQLAEKARMSAHDISDLESGKETPSVDQLINIADALYISLDDLVGRSSRQWIEDKGE